MPRVEFEAADVDLCLVRSKGGRHRIDIEMTDGASVSMSFPAVGATSFTTGQHIILLLNEVVRVSKEAASQERPTLRFR